MTHDATDTNQPQNAPKNTKEYFGVFGYNEGKSKRIGYGYKTEKGSLCIKADPMFDKNQLGKLLINGLYFSPDKKN